MKRSQLQKPNIGKLDIKDSHTVLQHGHTRRRNDWKHCWQHFGMAFGLIVCGWFFSKFSWGGPSGSSALLSPKNGDVAARNDNKDNSRHSSVQDGQDVIHSEDEPPTTNNDPTDYCHYYDGVLWIGQGDRNGAFGTIFYLFVLNQLLYAERYNLQPFIHLEDVSRHVYDPEVHGIVDATVYSMGPEMEVTWEEYTDPLVPEKIFRYPGRPVVKDTPDSDKRVLEVEGTGIWDSYYESIVPLTLGPSKRQSTFQVDITKPCPNKPWVRLKSDEQLVQGLHLNCPYCVRAWKYGGVPPSLRQQGSVSSSSYHDWWHSMRHSAEWMVSKYYHPKSHLLEAAEKATQPSMDSAIGNQQTPNRQDTSKCLAMHIRHSDKANKRDKIALAAFLPYCQAYVEAGGKLIYLATDSSRVIDKIKEEWPPHVTSAITWQRNIIRSPNETAVFDPAVLSYAQENGGGGGQQQQHHHRTNSEVLVDILAMSRCQWLLHGLSAVSEATIYTNLKLHDSSVNLEFYRYYKRNPQKVGANSDEPLSVESLQQRLQQG